MKMRAWITGGLAALAVGGLVAAYPLTSMASGSSAGALTTEAAAAAQTNKATNPQPYSGGCGGQGGGMMRGGMMRGGMMGGFQGAYGGIVLESVLKLTGLDEQKIIKDRREGKSFVEIAKTKGVTEDQLLTEAKKEHQAFIDEKVKDGIMTKEMADVCTENFEANIKAMLENTAVGTKSGRSRAGRGMMGGWQQAPAQGESL